MTAAAAGLGLVQTPTFFAREALALELVEPVLDAFQPEPYPVSLVYPPSRRLSAAVRAFAERRVAFVGERFTEVSDDRPDLSPAQVLARVFTDEGYVASVHDGPVGEQLCQQHCPVSHVAHEFPQLCEAETEAIASVLGTHVQRLATIAHGDGVCTTCIPHIEKERVTR